jgi:hypothetical protein
MVGGESYVDEQWELEAAPSSGEQELLPTDDLISRAAVLSAIQAHVGGYDDHYMHCLTKCVPELITKLPATRTSAPAEQELSLGHVWIDGPDGPRYHCAVCSISKRDDYDCYDTCESWIKELATRTSTPAVDELRLEHPDHPLHWQHEYDKRLNENRTPAVDVQRLAEEAGLKVQEEIKRIGGLKFAVKLDAIAIIRSVFEQREGLNGD